MHLHRLLGIYHADGSPTGELRYLVGRMLGRTHCSLCDVTHAGVREKPEFQRCRRRFPVPIETLHLDEREPTVARFTDGLTPCVVAQTDEGLVLILDRASLDRCEGDVGRFEVALRAALAAHGWGTGVA